MTATMAVTTAETTVDDVLGKILGELGASLGVLLNALGTRAGLWAAMAGAGPLTPADVANRTGLSKPLVREWLRAQARRSPCRKRWPWRCSTRRAAR
jgi:hypothetical protein